MTYVKITIFGWFNDLKSTFSHKKPAAFPVRFFRLLKPPKRPAQPPKPKLQDFKAEQPKYSEARREEMADLELP